MKIGITINEFYKRYLEEIAKFNNISITSVCGLIVENFLSYNQSEKRIPLFRKNVSVLFAKNNSSVVDDKYENEFNSGLSKTREELLAELDESNNNDSVFDSVFDPLE